MGWDFLAVSCTGGRPRKDGREAMNTPVRVWLQTMAAGPGAEHIQRTYLKEDIDPSKSK